MKQPKTCNCNCKKNSNEEAKVRTLSSVAEELSNMLGIGVEVVMVEDIKEEDQQPMSKEEWNAIRLDELSTYIMNCAATNKKINQELLVEYNKLVAQK